MLFSMKTVTMLGILMITTVGSGEVIKASSIDNNLPEYQAVKGINGHISSIGSDTLANLMTYWSQQFKQLYPDVAFSIQAAGSSTAPSGLTEKVSSFGPMSRKMKTEEQAEFEDKFGYSPLAIPVAIDALAVYVNKENPIKGLTMPQVDAIFSSTNKCGYQGKISKWGDAGMSGSWTDDNIQLYGRNSISGTYGFFRKKALCKGQYKTAVSEQAGSAAVVEKISTEINSIGYSGIGYKTSGVRVVPLSEDANKPYITASVESAISGKYPLARFLYIYVNKKPGQALPALEKEFLKLVLSQQGQQSVTRDGYIALPAEVIAKTLKEIN